MSTYVKVEVELEIRENICHDEYDKLTDAVWDVLYDGVRGYNSLLSVAVIDSESADEE